MKTKDKYMKYLVLFVWLLSFNILIAQENVHTEISKEKLDKIYSLFELVNITAEADNSLEMLVDYFERLAPNIPKEYWQEQTKLFNKEQYLNDLAVLYDKKFTEKEIEDLNNFFKSSTGNKWINILPEISQDSYKILQDWQAKMAVKVRENLINDGYIKTIDSNNNSGGKNE